MNTSEKFTDVTNALMEIQEQMVVEPDGENKHLKARYATLDNILKTVKPILKGVELVVLQTIETVESTVKCTTRIMHSGGQWIEIEALVYAEKSSPQGIGSAITYARRYSLSTALGIGMNSDDDGNAAETAMTKAEEKKKAEDDLQMYRGKIIPRLIKYDQDIIQAAFEEQGCISDCEDKEEMACDLVKQVMSKDKLILIGKRCKALQDEASKGESNGQG